MKRMNTHQHNHVPVVNQSHVPMETHKKTPTDGSLQPRNAMNKLMAVAGLGIVAYLVLNSSRMNHGSRNKLPKMSKKRR